MRRFAFIPFVATCLIIGDCLSMQTQKIPLNGRTYKNEALQTLAFPLGGIGSGSVSLGGRGDLRDWEICNRPNKHGELPYTFFALWAQKGKEKPVAKILERQYLPPYTRGGFGIPQNQLAGVARLDDAEFTGAYPFAHMRFFDKEMPVDIELEAWNPFIPLNTDDSAIPVAIFSWTLKNPSDKPVNASIAFSLANEIGNLYTDVQDHKPGLGENINQYKESDVARGIYLSSLKVKPETPHYGSMAMLTPWREVDIQTEWYSGGWWDKCHLFWDDFSDDGAVKTIKESKPSKDGQGAHASMVLHIDLAPGEEKTVPVILAWHFPWRENYWNSEPELRGKIMKNHFGNLFDDAWNAGLYTIEHLQRLQRETRAFQQALFSSTLPEPVIDAVSSQLSILKTNVCLLLQDKKFYAFEGNGDDSGCCWMNCTHVWNYEQTLAFLFPELERSMRETEFLHNTLANGYMPFRTLLPIQDFWWKYKPAADGQMGTIMRVYRDWKFCGNDEWLRKLWPKIKLALEFAWKGCGDPPPKGLEWTAEKLLLPWDANQDGVMEAEQHNTYDIEFYGPNTMMGSLYLGALKAASEMATRMGDDEAKMLYLKLYEQGRKKYDRDLWNGEYYRQDVRVLPGLQVPEHLISPENKACGPDCKCSRSPGGKKAALSQDETVPKYQYGEGCLSDQLLGQYLAHVCGLGYLLDENHVRQAVKAIFDYNFRDPIGDFSNVQRVYALNDEAGLLLCSWPKGNRPVLPFVYSDEVWSGIEYQVAATLIYNGWTEEGLEMVEAVRQRYNGIRRNPWDEEECGHHYARALAGWSVLLALSGFYYDGVDAEMRFAAQVSGEAFQTFWSTASAWGIYKQQKSQAALEVLYGRLNLSRLVLQPLARQVKVTLDGDDVMTDFQSDEEKMILEMPDQIIDAGSSLVVEFSAAGQ